MFSRRTVSRMFFLSALVFGLSSPQPLLADEPKPNAHTDSIKVAYRTVKIDGLDIFYREAGPKDAPTVLLLHGFPASSHMFRNLIPALERFSC